MIQMDSTIAIQGVRVHMDSSCPLAISTFSDPECTTGTTVVPSVSTRLTPGTENITSTGVIVGGVVIVIVVIVLAVTVIVIAILVIKNRKSGSSIDQDMG